MHGFTLIVLQSRTKLMSRFSICERWNNLMTALLPTDVLKILCPAVNEKKKAYG